MAEPKEKKRSIFEPPKNRDARSIADAISKNLGASISTLANEESVIDASHIVKYPTTILSLDKYLGVGGLLGGRILDISGWEGTGKTLTALTVAGGLQKTGAKVAFLDAEGTFSRPLASAIGVDVDNLILIQSTPEKIMCGEDYFDVMSMLIQSGVELIIVDSVPALIPAGRLTARVGYGQKATHASLMAEGLQQVTTLLNANKKSVLWFINQRRAKPMVMFGPSEEPTGGNALKFFATYRLEVKKLDDIVKEVATASGRYEEEIIGVSIKCILYKNKTASIPINPIDYDVYFKHVVDKNGVVYEPGVDIYKDIVNTALMAGVIEQSSSWFSYGQIKENGRDALIAKLRQAGPDIIKEIRAKVLGEGQ